MKKLFSVRTSDTSFNIGTFVLRAGLGTLMLMNHGLNKMMNYGQYASKFADPFGITPEVSLALTVFAEFFCAAFLIVGLFTRLAAIPLIIAMAVALFYSHNGEIFGEGKGAAIFLFGFIAVLFLGPGKISLDRFIGK